MATIIQSGKRRCDASCYNSKMDSKKCKCICGGSNHGKGLKRAAEQTLAWARAQKEQAEDIMITATNARLVAAQENVFRGSNAGISL